MEQRFPCSPWRTPRRSRWLGLEKAVTPWESPRWSSSWRTAARGKHSRCRSLWRTVCRGRVPTVEQEKSVRSPPPEEEGAAETTCDELTATPIPVPLCCCGGGGRGIRSKAEPGKKGGVGGRCVFKIWFCFSLSYSDLIGNKLNWFIFSPNRVCFACDHNW